mmetsp:Transcript_21320/g.48722  ORF Transcript_21320/g.48722 Transcript_21320/m.48722 type:complete len:200 (-) Transcript_21320:277-876(-)
MTTAPPRARARAPCEAGRTTSARHAERAWERTQTPGRMLSLPVSPQLLGREVEVRATEAAAGTGPDPHLAVGATTFGATEATEVTEATVVAAKAGARARARTGTGTISTQTSAARTAARRARVAARGGRTTIEVPARVARRAAGRRGASAKTTKRCRARISWTPTWTSILARRHQQLRRPPGVAATKRRLPRLTIWTVS